MRGYPDSEGSPMKLLRVMPVPRDIRHVSDIVAGDVAVFAHSPAMINAGDEVAVFEGADSESGDTLANLTAETSRAVKAYSFMYANSPNGFLFVLRSKETP